MVNVDNSQKFDRIVVVQKKETGFYLFILQELFQGNWFSFK